MVKKITKKLLFLVFFYFLVLESVFASCLIKTLLIVSAVVSVFVAAYFLGPSVLAALGTEASAGVGGTGGNLLLSAGVVLA